jgi:hypothetical protein
MTNTEIFTEAINQDPLNAGILREALDKYAQMINKLPDNTDWGMLSFEGWKQRTNKMKDFIDKLYDDNH